MDFVGGEAGGYFTPNEKHRQRLFPGSGFVRDVKDSYFALGARGRGFESRPVKAGSSVG